MACVYSIDGGKNYLTESDFKNYLKNNLEDLVNGKDIDLSKFSNVVPKSNVTEITKPTNQEELATMLEKKFGRNPMLAQAEAKLFDLRAEVWSRLTGNSKQDFYDRVSYGQEKSDEGLNQIIGEQGASRLDNAEIVLADLNVAREMEKAGKTPKEIYLATSWQKGHDKKWKYEIPYIKSLNKSVFNKAKTEPVLLVDLIGENDLFKAYPKLKQLKVALSKSSYYSGGKQIIYIKDTFTSLAAKSILLHEIQHAIQLSEGFYFGTSGFRELEGIKYQYNQKLIQELYNQNKEYRELYDKGEALPAYKEGIDGSWSYNKEREIIDDKLTNIFKDYLAKNPINEEEALEEAKKRYYNNYGEVEARNVQNRMNMTSKERKAKMFLETEDIVKEQQVVIQDALQQKQGNTTRGQIKFTDKVKGFNNAVMSLFKTAKADTFVHEFSHLNFQDMLAMANDNEQIKADVKTAIEFFNQHAKPSERIKNVDEAVEYLLSIDPANHLRDDTYVKVHEAFANGFTEYLRNPNSNIPTALREIYEVLKNYLADLAQYIAGSQAKLTPEMEAVYRRLFEPEFVNNIKETAENRSVEREAIEMEQPIVKYNDDIAKDAFSSFDTLEQGDRPTPNQIFKSKIEEWKKEGKTDSTFVMEQLNQFIEDIAPEENKKILKDFIKTKRAEYEELADGKKILHQRTRTLLENKGLSLDDKERIYQDDNYALVSFIELQKDVDAAIKEMTYNEIIANEALLKDKLAETTNPNGYAYAETLFNINKVKKGFDYLDELRRNPKKNAKEIEKLNERLHNELFALREQGTNAARTLAAQKFFDILTPQILVENIKRQQEAKRTEAQNAKLKEEVEILKEKVEKGVANEEIHQAIVDELEAKVEVLQERLTDYDKQISKLEAKIKEEKDQSKQSVIENLKERALGRTKNSKTLKVDKQEVSNKKSELKNKLQSLIDSNLYSEDNPESPLQVLQEYIENHVLEQQSELAKKVSLSDMIKHLEEEGLPIPPATIAEAYKKARVRLIQEGVNRRAIDADATIDLTLEALEAKKDIEVLKAEKKALQDKIKNGVSSVDKLITEAVKGVKWKDRVVNYNRDAAEKEVVDKVIQNNPDLSDAEKQAVEQRVKDLFREKTEQWTANQINRVEKKGQPKKKREISNNIAKLSNLISTGNFSQGVNEALAEELGLAGITADQRTQITSRMDVIKSLRHGTLRDFAIEDLSAYIMSITNPQMFAHNIWTSTVYTEMLSNIVSSAQNATGLIVSFDKAITDTILNLDSTYLKNFFAAFNKGMLRSALQKGYFKSNEHFDLAQSEGGFSPFRGSEYAGKYGKNLDSKRRRFLAKYRSIKTTYLGGKFITRLNEGIDNISYANASESAAYKHIKKIVKRENPNVTKEEIENMVYEKMFPIKPSEARAMAIKDLNESALTLSFRAIPTESEINRVSFDIMQQARDEDTKEIMERESLKGTYRNKPSAFNKGGGVVEGFSAAYEWAMSGAKNSIKNSKLNQSAKNKWMTALNISKILTLPFSRTPANIIEIGTHYAVLGGAAKIASLQAYKKGLKGTQGISVEAEREYITQYQKDVAVRMAKGAALLTILPVVFAMLNDDKDDDELQDGVYGNSKNNPTKIKNSIVIGGKIIPLNFLGALAPVLAVLGAKSDLERDKKYTDVSDESIKNDIHGIDNYVEATKNWMFSVVKSTPLSGSSRTVESISDFLNDKKTEGLGKMIGTQLAYSYLPSPRMINDVISWEYTKAPEPHGFVQGMIRGTYTPALIAMGVSKPMFDNRGREVDIRDKSFMSVGGVYKRLASEPNDKYDNILLNHKIMLPFMKADSYLKNGRELTPDEFYKFSKGVADKYNQMITNTSSIPKVYYIEKEDGEVEKVNVHGLKYTLNQIKAYKNMSMDELEKIGSVDLQADRELYKAIMDNYKTIIKQQMHTMRIEKNSYSNYEDRMLSEYEKEKLEKNKKELRDNLKKP